MCEDNDFLETILESMGEGVVVTDQSLSVRFFNQKAEELTGLSRHHVIGLGLDDVFKLNPWIIDIAKKVIRDGYLVTDYGQELFKSSRQSLPVGVTASPLISKEGRRCGIVISLKDISGLKPLQEERLREERLVFVGTLAAGIAHEVRNPLGGIKGAIQLLSRRLGSDEEILEYTKVINDEVERIDRVLDDLLHFTNPRAYRFMPLNIHMILDRVIKLFSIRTEAEGIEFVKVYDPSIPYINGYEDGLTQVFLNIIKNAIEAMEDKGRIDIVTKVIPDFSLRGEKGIKKMVCIEISDTGKGIDEDELSIITTPFYTTKEKGTGLGLSLSLKIIDEHKGYMHIESEKGKGTKVSVLLPLTIERVEQ